MTGRRAAGAGAAFAALLWAAALQPAFAQEPEIETIPFAGGELTIREDDESQKILAFDGTELLRDWFVFFDGIHEVGGAEIALFEAGGGGNACDANTFIVWRPPGGAVEAVQAGEECDSPPASVSPHEIHFVPFLLPGESRPVQAWSPASGLGIAGILSFAPQPGTGWDDLAGGLDHMLEAFDNAAVYEASRALLGDELTSVARGLSVGVSPQTQGETIFGSGCVPHACGSADAFMAIDRAARRVYFARQSEDGAPESWPDAAGWPEPLRAAMTDAIGR